MQITTQKTNIKQNNQTPGQTFIEQHDAGVDWLNKPVTIITTKGLTGNYLERKPLKPVNETVDCFVMKEVTNLPFKISLKAVYSIERTLHAFDAFIKHEINKQVDKRLLLELDCKWTHRFKKIEGVDFDGLVGFLHVLETLTYFKDVYVQSLPLTVIDRIMEAILQKAFETGSINQFFAKIDSPLKAMHLLLENQTFKKEILVPAWIAMLELLILFCYLDVTFERSTYKDKISSIEIDLSGLDGLIEIDNLVKILKEHFGFKNIQIQ